MPACAKLTKNGPIDYQYDYRSGSNRKARPAAFSVLAGGRKPSCFRGFGVVKRWLYGANNPVSLSDPDGLEPGPTPSPSPGPPVPKYPSAMESFDRGSSFSECIANCFEAANFLGGPGTGALAAAGAPIPKSVAARVGVRVSSFGGASRVTTLPSMLAQKLKLGPRNFLRKAGRVVSPVFTAYGGYLAIAEVVCLKKCDEAHSGCEDFKM